MACQSEHVEQLDGLIVNVGKDDLGAALFSDVDDAEENRYSDTVNEFGVAEINNQRAATTLELPPTATLTSAPGSGVNDSSANVLGFNLRNVNTVGTPTGVLFDELRFGTNWADVMPAVPEPTAVGLLGFGLLAIGHQGQRKR